MNITKKKSGVLLITFTLVLMAACEKEDKENIEQEVQPTEVRESTRGMRYCELLIINQSPQGQIVGDTWGTQGLNDCPNGCLDELDLNQIANETGALNVMVNGPRLVVIDDGISIKPSDTTTFFGCLEMGLQSFLIIDPNANSGAYVETITEQNKTFTWYSGSEIYELTSPNNDIYVMQTMSLQVDSTLTLEGLSQLDTHLQLPAGWSYNARILTEDLTIEVKEIGIKLSDDLNNTYQKRTL